MGYLCIAALIFAGELGIKNYVEKKRNAGEEKEICKGRILLRKYHNKGACMNLGEKKSNVVAGLSLILTAVLALVFLFTLTRHGNGWLKAGLSLLLGGAFSNTYDRLKRKYVVDYFSIQRGRLKNVVLNLGDVYILVGGTILLLKELAGTIKNR